MTSPRFVIIDEYGDVPEEVWNAPKKSLPGRATFMVTKPELTEATAQVSSGKTYAANGMRERRRRQRQLGVLPKTITLG